MVKDQRQSEYVKPLSAPRTNVFLSLYLVVFGFFIVLVNQSELSQSKSSAVISSVNETFFQNHSIGPSRKIEAQIVSEKSNASLRRAVPLLQSAFPGAQFSLGNEGRDLRIQLAPETLFFANTAAIRAEAKAAIENLADLLTVPVGSHQKVYLSVPGTSILSASKSNNTSSELRRAVVLSEKFVDGGLARKNIFVAQHGDVSDLVVITIRSRERAQAASLPGSGA